MSSFTRLRCETCKAATVSNTMIDDREVTWVLRQHNGHVLYGTVGHAKDSGGSETTLLERKDPSDPVQQVSRFMFRRMLDEYERLMPPVKEKETAR